jgi:hypothetical protein
MPSITVRYSIIFLAVGSLLGSLGLTACSSSAASESFEIANAASPSLAERASRNYRRWESASFGGGGYIQNVMLCPSTPGRLYAYVDVGGVYRSDDIGGSWRMLHGGMPSGDGFYSVRGLWVDPNNPDRLALAVGNQWSANRGIFLSRDGGETWEKRLDAPFLGNEQHRSCGTIFLALTDGRLLAGSAGGGLFASRDAGETWTSEGFEGVNITDLDAGPDGTIWVCAQPHRMPDKREIRGGFFRQEAGGVWEELPAGPDELTLAPDGTLIGIFDSAEIRQSRDGGKSWGDFSEGLPVKHESVKGYASESRFRALAAGPDFLLLGSSRGTVYRRNVGEPEWVPVERLGVIEMIEGRPWWGRMRAGKWQHFGGAMGSLIIHPSDPSHWWFTDWYGIYETRDAGANWTLRIDGIEVTVIHVLAQDPADPGRVHAGMADNGYVGSLDGGRLYDVEKFTSNMKALALDASLPGRVYGTGSQGGEWKANTLWVSVDAGGSWMNAPMRGLPSASQRWMNSLAVRPGHPYQVAVALAGTVGENGGVWRSLDGGRTFAPLFEGMESVGKFFQEEIFGRVAELAWAQDGTMVAASHSTGRLFARPADGAWQETGQGLPGQPFYVRHQGSNFFMTRGPGGLWRSADGVSWEQILKDPAEILAVDAVRLGRLAVASNGQIRLSTDGGATWEELGAPPMGQISALAFAGERLLAGTRGSGFFLTALDGGGNAVVAGAAAPGTLPVTEAASASLPAPQWGWTNPWRKSGELKAEKLDENFGVQLASVGGPASGSTGLVFPATGEPFRITGAWKVSGEGAVAKLASRAFDANGQQIQWQPLAELVIVGQANNFDCQIELPPEAARGEVVLLFEGTGSVELTEFRFARPDPLLGHPVSNTNHP